MSTYFCEDCYSQEGFNCDGCGKPTCKHDGHDNDAGQWCHDCAENEACAAGCSYPEHDE